MLNGSSDTVCFPSLISDMGLFQGTAAGTKNKLPGLITSMETTGAKALEEFADNIKVGFSSVVSDKAWKRDFWSKTPSLAFSFP